MHSTAIFGLHVFPEQQFSAALSKKPLPASETLQKIEKLHKHCGRLVSLNPVGESLVATAVRDGGMGLLLADLKLFDGEETGRGDCGVKIRT